jgi:hypothetical protein
MKFKLGIPTDLEELSQNEDWKELENISSFFIFKILILGFGILISTFFYQFIKEIISIREIYSNYMDNWYIVFLLIPLHEVCHALLYPNFGLSDKSIFGFWPKKFVFYSYYDLPLKRDRIIIAMLAPLFILTVIPVLLISVFELNYIYLAILAVLNSIGGAGDIFYSVLIFSQVPKNSVVKTDTARVFWKEV